MSHRAYRRRDRQVVMVYPPRMPWPAFELEHPELTFATWLPHHDTPVIAARWLTEKYKGCILVPLAEEAVLPVGVATHPLALSVEAALASSSRFTQRTALPVELSPRWSLSPWPDAGTLVVKAAASQEGVGVMVIDDVQDATAAARRVRLGAAEELAWLAAIPTASTDTVFEEHLDGPQFEVSGVVGEPGVCIMWDALQQRWSGGRILEYLPAPADRQRELVNVAEEAVVSLGLAWCGFCVEIRQGKVVEVNARLGEDELGYDELLRGCHASRYHRLAAELEQLSQRSGAW